VAAPRCLRNHSRGDPEEFRAGSLPRIGESTGGKLRDGRIRIGGGCKSLQEKALAEKKKTLKENNYKKKGTR